MSLPTAGLVGGMESAIVNLTPITPSFKEFFPTNSPRRIHEDDLNRLILSPLSSPIRRVEVEVADPWNHETLPSPGFERHFCAFTHECPLCPLEDWLKDRVDGFKPGSIYILGSGTNFPPGTGKRKASLHQLLKDERGYFPPRLPIFVDCKVLRTCESILSQVAKEINPGSSPSTILDAINAIHEAVERSTEFLVLFLDHPDKLSVKDCSVLNLAFKCLFTNISSKPSPRMVRVADLAPAGPPKRPVVRRQTLAPPNQPSGVQADPKEFEMARQALHLDPPVQVQPFSKEQLVALLTTRLEEKGVGHVISPNGIRFLCAKMAKVSGDARLTLNLCKRALQIVEVEARKSASSSLPLKIPQVEIGDMWRVVDPRGSHYASGLGTIGENTPLQQQILLASLLLILKHGRVKEVTMGKLVDTYRKVMKKRRMSAEPEASCVGMYVSNSFWLAWGKNM